MFFLINQNFLCGLVLACVSAGALFGEDFVVYQGTKKNGPGHGKHVVFLTGDEEYRSEEGLVQMAQILAFRHGFHCTVLFAIDPGDGTINPNVNDSLPGAEALDRADLLVMGLRFRRYPDDIMQHFVAAYLAGKPIVAIRTSTHAFQYGEQDDTSFRRYSFRDKQWPGGFGRQVLGETWVTHLGTNHEQATKAVSEPKAAQHELMRGVATIFALSGAYTANPPADVTILMRAEVLDGMTPDSPRNTSGKNDPNQPVAWCRIHENEQGNQNRVLCTTMGAANDFLDESLRRLVVNGVYWGLKMDVPPGTDVRCIGEFRPTDFGFDGFRKGVKPDDLNMSVDEALSADASPS